MRGPQTNGFILVGAPLTLEDCPPCDPASYAPMTETGIIPKHKPDCRPFLGYTKRIKNTCFYNGLGNVLFNDALNTCSYGYMASNIWLRTIQIAKPASASWPLFLISSKGLLYTPSHRQDNIYHGLCYTSREALTGTRNSSMGPIAPWVNALTTELYLAPCIRDYVLIIFLF